MSKIPRTATVIRSGSFNALGALFCLIGCGLLAFNQLTLNPNLVIIIGAVFLLLGFRQVFRNSQYGLYIDQQALHWFTHGDTPDQSIPLANIDKMVFRRFYWGETKVPSRIRLRMYVQLKNGTREMLPLEIQLGGSANPKFRDIAEALSNADSSIELQIEDETNKSL